MRTRGTMEIDRYVGARIRERRILLGLTQQQLADAVAVTYQQAHKYERGINRVSAGRLFEIGKVLQVPVAYFYEGIEDQEGRAPNPRERICLEVARNLRLLPDDMQNVVSTLVRGLVPAEAAAAE